MKQQKVQRSKPKPMPVETMYPNMRWVEWWEIVGIVFLL